MHIGCAMRSQPVLNGEPCTNLGERTMTSLAALIERCCQAWCQEFGAYEDDKNKGQWYRVGPWFIVVARIETEDNRDMLDRFLDAI